MDLKVLQKKSTLGGFVCTWMDDCELRCWAQLAAASVSHLIATTLQLCRLSIPTALVLKVHSVLPQSQDEFNRISAWRTKIGT